MTRGEAQEAKVHFKGKEDDFVVMVESADAVKRWKEDKSVPLVEVVSSFDVFCTHKQGAQGQFDRASNAVLENEFGTKKEEEVVIKILEQGDVQETKSRARQGDRNQANATGA